MEEEEEEEEQEASGSTVNCFDLGVAARACTCVLLGDLYHVYAAFLQAQPFR